MRKEEPRIDVDLWAECFLANDGKPNVTRMAPFIDALGTYGTARLGSRFPRQTETGSNSSDSTAKKKQTFGCYDVMVL